MSKLIVSEFVTLDGGIEDPGGAEGSPYGGWAFKFEQGEEGMKFKLDETMGAGSLLLGRKTYEGFAAAWPSRSGDSISDKLNSMPKYVVSSTLEQADWNPSTIIAGDVFERVRALKADQNVLVWGSPTLVASLMKEDLVDEHVLLMSPIVRADGIKLFRDAGGQHDLKITGSTVLGGGMLALRLEPART
jgi:dihydrofolate reductase